MFSSWFEKFEGLFKKELPKKENGEEDLDLIFSRFDVDKFFQHLNNYYNPSKLIRKLGGIQNFDLLKKDTDIYASLDKRLAALLDTKLTFQGEDAELVKLFTEELSPFERQLKQDFFDTQFNGYGVEQIIYDSDGSGKIIGFQKEQFWRFEPLPDLIHVRLMDTTNDFLRGKVLDWGKWVLTTNNGTYYNPMGEPLAEKLIQPWIFKCNGWDLWIDFAKRFANGFMHAKIEDQNKKEEVRMALEKAGKSAILVTDKNADLNLIQASRDSSIYVLLNDRTIASINKAITGETLSSTMEERGSSAAANTHNDVRLEKTLADIALVESAINQIVEMACAVRGIEGRKLPKAKLIFDPSLNLELATRDSQLKSQGVVFNKKYYISNYGLKDDEFEIVENQGFPSLFKSENKKRTFLKPEDVSNFLGYKKPCGHNHNLDLNSNLNRKINRSFNEKEELVQLMNRIEESPISTEDLIAAISVSKTSKELDENLSKLFDQRNNDFSEVLAMALYNSAAKGALLGNSKYIKKEDQNEA